MTYRRWYSSVMSGICRIGLRRGHRRVRQTPEGIGMLLDVVDGLSGPVPQGFLAQGVPIWPNLRGVTHTNVDDGKTSRGGTATILNIAGETPDSREQIFDFYRKELSQGGWQPGDRVEESPGLFCQEFKRGSRSVAVATSQSVLPPMTTLLLTVTIPAEEQLAQSSDGPAEHRRSTERI